MKVYSVLSVGWRRGSVFSAIPIAACSSLEQAKEALKKAIDSEGYSSLCFKINKNGTGAISTLYNNKMKQEEIRILVSNINIEPKRLNRLGLFINYFIADKIRSGNVSKTINNVIEANKVRVMFEGTVFKYIRQDVSDDEFTEFRKFYEKIQYTNPPKIEYTNLLEIQYIDSPEE